MRHNVCAILLLLGCGFFGLSTRAAAEVADCSLVPGWQQAGALRHFTTENLYEYMDGNSESYFAYGFVQMEGVTCKSGEKTFVIDVSEMIDADAAYGIFSANRDPDHPLAKIGMGGQVLPRRGTFAKGKYYVEIAASPEGDHSQALAAFITAMEKRVEGTTALPEQLSWFPTEGLAGVRLIPQSVLGIRLLKRGYVAQYAPGKAFVVTETSAQSAAVVMQKLRARYASAQPVHLADEAIQMQDNYLGSVCIFRKGKYLGGYANLPDAQAAQASSEALAARVP